MTKDKEDNSKIEELRQYVKGVLDKRTWNLLWHQIIPFVAASLLQVIACIIRVTR